MEAAYDTIGRLYRRHRAPDPRIAAQIEAALGDARTVVNVGAGSGSYEPTDRHVLAVEPSKVMIAQRSAGAAPVVQGTAEALPLADGCADAALALLTVHHWSDQAAGLAEMRRVSRRQVVFAFDLEVNHTSWLVTDYFPEIVDIEDARNAPVEWIAEQLGGNARIEDIPIPADCVDGFQNAYWRRPEAYLNPDVRACISTLAVLPDDVLTRGLQSLEHDLATGTWHQRNADLLAKDVMDYGYRLIVAHP